MKYHRIKTKNFLQRRAAYQNYIINVLGLLAQEAGVTDENLINRTLTVVNDVLTIERYLAEVSELMGNIFS